MINVHGYFISEKILLSKGEETLQEKAIVDAVINELKQTFPVAYRAYSPRSSAWFAVVSEGQTLNRPLQLQAPHWGRPESALHRWIMPNSVPAQNANQPTSLFVYHILHEYESVLHDPSYGVRIPGPDQESLYENTGVKLTRGVILMAAYAADNFRVFYVPLEAASTGDIKLDWQ